jgi:hypothetical protein
VTESGFRQRPPSRQKRPCTALVWIDSREAVIVRWMDGRSRIERIESEIPAHHRATGHVRHDPCFRHGGGGVRQTAGEPHRLEHLERFLDKVAAQVRDEDLLLLGPGTIREHLERRIHADDDRRHITRTVKAGPAGPWSERRLIAQLRQHLGDEPRRHTTGSYRWTGPVPATASGRRLAIPRRIVDKPPRAPRSSAEER